MTEELKQDYLRKMYKISGLAMKLYNELKYGFSEPIYQECLAILFTENNIPWWKGIDNDVSWSTIGENI